MLSRLKPSKRPSKSTSAPLQTTKPQRHVQAAGEALGCTRRDANPNATLTQPNLTLAPPPLCFSPTHPLPSLRQFPSPPGPPSPPPQPEIPPRAPSTSSPLTSSTPTSKSTRSTMNRRRSASQQRRQGKVSEPFRAKTRRGPSDSEYRGRDHGTIYT